jgi:endonuclease IV
MKYIGAHVSASGGVFNAPKNAYALGATAFSRKISAVGMPKYLMTTRLKCSKRLAYATILNLNKYCHMTLN